MQELFEFRIPEAIASRYLPATAGVSLGNSVRRIQLQRSDPLFGEIRRLESEFNEAGEAFVVSWDVRRTYSPGELARAEIFHLLIARMLETSGEEAGTQYDEATACALCGLGRIQRGALRMEARYLPRNGAGIVVTLAGEVLISSRVAALLEDGKWKGVDIRAIEVAGPRRAASVRWFQLMALPPPVEVTAPTRFGSTPFKEESAALCAHVAGLNVLSEVFVERSSWVGQDFCSSSIQIGTSGGLVRPSPLFFLSPRLLGVLRAAGVGGFRVEVSHFVPSLAQQRVPRTPLITVG